MTKNKISTPRRQTHSSKLGAYYWPFFAAVLVAVAVITWLVSAAALRSHESRTHDTHQAQGHHSNDSHGHGHAHHGEDTLEPDSGCTAPGKTITTNLGSNGFDSPTLQAQLCDVLKIQNTSGRSVKIAIGPHSRHIHYPGYEEQTVSTGATVTITLNTTGEFRIHDHYDDSHFATVTVVR